MKTAWANCVLKAHGVERERARRGGSLTNACLAKLAEIDLHVHDLRHQCASRRYFDQGWTIYDVSILLGHADVKTKRLHDLVARPILKVVR